MNERKLEEKLLIAIGSPGIAMTAIARQLLGTLIKKKVLSRVEVVATLDLAAEAVEKQKKDKLARKYVAATSAIIRDLSKEFQGDAWNPPVTH